MHGNPHGVLQALHCERRHNSHCVLFWFLQRLRCRLRLQVSNPLVLSADPFLAAMSMCQQALRRAAHPGRDRGSTSAISARSCQNLEAQHDLRFDYKNLKGPLVCSRDCFLLPYPRPIGNDGQLPLLSTNADGIHATDNAVGPQMINCYFGGLGARLSIPDL